MGKKAQRLSVAYGLDDENLPADTCIRFTVLDAADKVVQAIVIDAEELPEAIRDRAYLYGVNKLLTDRTSGQTDKLAKLKEMVEVFDMLKSGEWQKERQVGAIVVSASVEALARIKGITVPVAQKALASYDKETREKILANPQVAKLAEEIKAEREAAQQVSLDDLAS